MPIAAEVKHKRRVSINGVKEPKDEKSVGVNPQRTVVEQLMKTNNELTEQNRTLQKQVAEYQIAVTENLLLNDTVKALKAISSKQAIRIRELEEKELLRKKNEMKRLSTVIDSELPPPPLAPAQLNFVAKQPDCESNKSEMVASKKSNRRRGFLELSNCANGPISLDVVKKQPPEFKNSSSSPPNIRKKIKVQIINGQSSKLLSLSYMFRPVGSSDLMSSKKSLLSESIVTSVEEDCIEDSYHSNSTPTSTSSTTIVRQRRRRYQSDTSHSAVAATSAARQFENKLSLWADERGRHLKSSTASTTSSSKRRRTPLSQRTRAVDQIPYTTQTSIRRTCSVVAHKRLW